MNNNKKNNKYAFWIVRLFYQKKLLQHSIFGLITLFLTVLSMALGIFWCFAVLLIPEAAFALLLLTSIGVLVFLLFLGFSAVTYVLSKLNYQITRGYSVSRVGKAKRFALRSAYNLLLVPLSLGLLSPVRTMMLRRQLAEESTLNGHKISFSGGAGRLYSAYLPLWLMVGLSTLLICFLCILALSLLIVISPAGGIVSEEEIQGVIPVIKIAIGLVILSPLGFILAYSLHVLTFEEIFPNVPGKIIRYFIRRLEVYER